MTIYEGQTYPCGYPNNDGDPCRKRSVALYVDTKDEKMYRCRLHDGRTAQDWAAEHGILRVDIATVAA